MTNTTKNKDTNPLVQLIKTEPELVFALRPGDLVSGVVLEKNARVLLVDLGRHGTGSVYRSEMQNAREAVRGIKAGDPIHAKVIEVDNEDGYVELSLAEAGKQKSWDKIFELQEKNEPFTVKVAGFNKGGLTADVAGLLAFLPVSQLAEEHYPRIVSGDKTQIIQSLQKLAGQELSVKIIDANPRTNKLIISEKDAVEAKSAEFAKNYEVGQVIKGIVSGIADFGVFVKFIDNPIVEGMIHVGELDYRLVTNPKEIVKIDDTLEAKIIEIKDGRISLSLKALKEDPWKSIGDKYKEGATVKGKIYSFNPFGAVVELDPQTQAQVHVTEFGGIEEMKKAISIGKEYEFSISSVKPEDKRIVLKLQK